MSYSAAVDNAAETLKRKAELCRRLASQASDADVSRTLLEIVADLEAAIPIIEENETHD